VRNGARQVEVAVNGIGERAGNCSLEEVVMAIRTRADLLGVDHGLNTPELTRTSRLVSSLTGYGVQKNKAVVGANAFAHESGIHQHGVLADRLTYEIMKSEDVGRRRLADRPRQALRPPRLLQGGRGPRLRARRRGEAVRVRPLQGAGGPQGHRQLRGRAGDRHLRDPRQGEDDYQLVSLTVTGGTDVQPGATVGVRLVDAEVAQELGRGARRRRHRGGDRGRDGRRGLRAIRQAVGRDGVSLVSFQVAAVTGGIDALGEVTVTVEVEDGQRFTGRGVSTDIVEASARAYIDALNRSRRLVHRAAEFRP
jgi:2-isopropylmalate synthase